MSDKEAILSSLDTRIALVDLSLKINKVARNEQDHSVSLYTLARRMKAAQTTVDASSTTTCQTILAASRLMGLIQNDLDDLRKHRGRIDAITQKAHLYDAAHEDQDGDLSTDVDIALLL